MKAKDQAVTDAQLVHQWTTEIKLYERESQDWASRAKKILRRYKDSRSPRENNISRYNIFWSNVQTLQPMLYGNDPKPDIERRFRDDDPVGRVAADVLERATSYFVREGIFGNTMRDAVFDRLVPGRGTAWVRYVPHFKDAAVQGNQAVKDDGPEITDDVDDTEVPQEVAFEEVSADYVHWQDFGHSFGRTWEEVQAVWRKAYLTREALIKRFGEIGKSVPLDYSPKDLKDANITDVHKKATIYEIWDKSTKKVIWIHIDYMQKPLDVQDDPLKLKNFFPCPKPIYATLANDNLIPTPDYSQYQDQLLELDNLTSRIAAITKAIKVAGVYDASAEGVQRLLAEGVENQLIPVENWAIFGEKGGLKGVVDLMPMVDIANTLLTLYSARDKVKNDLYEISGLSDIIRGATDPDETAAAQKIKGQYASMRLGDMQREVHIFARDLVAIMAELIANHFSVDTLKKISGVKLMTMQEKQQVQMQMQQQAQMAQMQAQHAPQGPQQGAAPPPQPPYEVQEMFGEPSWDEVEQLLKDDTALYFRLDIETDSTIKADQEADKTSRIEFLGAVGGFLKQAMEVQDPTIAPLMAQLLMFGVRGFHVGKELEGCIHQTIDKLEKQAQQSQGQQKPDPAMEKIKADTQAKQQQAQMDSQIEQTKMQNEMKLEQMKMQMQQQQDAMLNKVEAERETMRQQNEMALETAKMQHEQALEQMKTQSNAQLEIILAHIRNAGQIESARISSKADDGSESLAHERSDGA